MSDGKKRKNVFRVIKLMRTKKMPKSLITCDVSSQTAIKGKAGFLPGNHKILRPNHSSAFCSQGIALLLELREHPVLSAPGRGRGSKAEVYQELLKGVGSRPPARLRYSCRIVPRTILSPNSSTYHPLSQGSRCPYDNALPSPSLPLLTCISVAHGKAPSQASRSGWRALLFLWKYSSC